MSAAVLVVEDERKIRDLLREYLEHDGYQVMTTGSGSEAIALYRTSHPDLILLDLRLPDVPGEEVAREVRSAGTTPILVLTAKTAEEDRIHGLELGVDDYVTKPFSPREVMLRVRAILRRSGLSGPDGALSFGGGALVIDESRHRVQLRGEPVELTPAEWRILTAMASSPGRVFSRYELVNKARGYEFEGYERVIDSHVKNLRRKLEEDPHEPHILETVLGAGYRLGVDRDS